MEHDAVGKVRARLAAWRHGNPARGVKVIAVAGAAGKTTTILLLSEILQETGRSVMSLTNHGAALNGESIDGRYDTSAEAMQRCLSRARKQGVEYVIVEVTDALVATQVIPTLDIEMSVVTNDALSARVLLDQPVEYTVVPYGFDIAQLRVAPHQAISFGEDESSEAQVTAVRELRGGTEIELIIDHQTKLNVATYLIGKANALNVAAAVSAAYVLATDTSTFDEGVARLERVAGNFDVISRADTPYRLIVDGAYRDESVSLVLATAQQLKKRRLLILADASVPSELYTRIKTPANRVIVVGSSLELPGVERADSLQAGFDLLQRGAKKDDMLLLLGRDVAALRDDNLTDGHELAGASHE